MKKPVFNLGLYLEGLRQTRLISILSAILISIVSGFTIVLTSIDMAAQYEYCLENSQLFTKLSFSGLSACPVLFAIGLVAAPCMTMILHQFQNKRNTSDFYHSIPHTRLCLFLSYQAAILTQVVFNILVCSIFSVILCLMASKFITLVVLPLVFYALATLVIALLMSAAVAMAMAITGTPFTNLILSALILFLPRIFLLVFSSVLGSIMPNAVEGHFLTFANPSLNMLIGLFTALRTFEFADQFASIPSLLYTLALGIAYTALAAWFFHKRKSEAAGFSAPSARLQSVYRIIIGTAITVISTLALYQSMQNDTGVDFATHVIVWTVGVVAYFLYELLTTKKWKNLLKCFPGLAIVFALNLVIVGATHVIFRTELSFTPDAEDIKSISIATEGLENGYRGYDFIDYVSAKADDVEIADRDLIKLIADSLKENVDDYDRLGRRKFRDKYYNRDNKYDDYGNPVDTPIQYTAFVFRIETATAVRYRKVWMPDDTQEKITEVLEANEEYRKLWSSLPSMIKGTGYIYSNSLWSIHSAMLDIDEGDYEEIHALLREEIRSCDFSTWFDAVKNGAHNSVFELEYSFLDGMVTRYLRVPIFTQVSPMTAKKIMNHITVTPEEFKALLDKARADKSSDSSYFLSAQLAVYHSEEDGGYIETWDIPFESIDDKKLDVLLSKVGKVEDLTPSSPILALALEYNIYSKDDYAYDSAVLLLPLNMTAKESISLIGKYDDFGKDDSLGYETEDVIIEPR